MFVFTPLFHTRILEPLTTNISFYIVHFSFLGNIILLVPNFLSTSKNNHNHLHTRLLIPSNFGYERKLILRFEVDAYLYLVVKKHARAGCWYTHRSALKNKRIGFDAKDSSREKRFKAQCSILTAIFSSSSTFLLPKLSF